VGEEGRRRKEVEKKEKAMQKSCNGSVNLRLIDVRSCHWE
jgi:hypothetical protein